MKSMVLLLIVAVSTSAGAADLLTPDCPRFVFESPAGDIAVGGGGAAGTASLPLPGGGRLEVETVVAKPDSPLVHYKWAAPPTKSDPDVALKWARFRMVDAPASLLLKEVVLEDIPMAAGSARVFPGSIQSYPVFAGSRFYGIEFPVARTRIENDRLLLAYWPGLQLENGEWLETHRAVAGDAGGENVTVAFHRYIAAHAQFRKRHTNYNSWWTSPAPYYTEKDILDLMAVFEEKMFKPHGSMFDTFCIDMGWSNKDSIWEIDPKLFPDGFTRLQQAADRMNCRLGLWISPSSRYPTAQDVQWARDNGFEAMKDGMCLGGAKYAAGFRDRLVEMARKYNIRHFKLDGYIFECSEPDHGHAAGALSADAVARGVIAAADAVHAVAPDAWFEPTGFGFNPSPWWLLHFNSVIGCFGDDAPWGRVPAPDYREAYTTGRDFFNLQSGYWGSVPAAGLEVLGVIHQTRDDFTNDAVMTVLRGHQFLPFYVNPAYMDDARWARLAAINSKAQQDEAGTVIPILPESWRQGGCPVFGPSTASGPAQMPREPYGYLNVSQASVLAVLRNPWVAPQEIRFDLSPYVDVWSMDVNAVYPEPRTYERAIRKGELKLELAPYETLVLNLEPDDSVEPAATRAKGRSCGCNADFRDSTRPIRLSSVKSAIQRVQYTGASGGLGPDWTSLVGDAASDTLLRLSALVTLNAPEGELLVLHDGSAAPEAAFTRITVNGAVVEPVAASSEAGWGATGAKRPEHWRFLRVPLIQRHSRILVETNGGGDGVLTSVWVRAMRDGAAPDPAAAWPEPEVVSLGGAPLFKPRDLTKESGKTVSMERPIERIDGVFLDAIDPSEASQGYGILQKNRAILESPLTIGGKQYRRGLGTHAPSRIAYALEGKFRRFVCWAGADAATTPTITMEVRVDGQSRWQSGMMTRGDVAQRVEVDLTGANTLELLVTDGGNGIGADHADWADARLLR